MHFAVGQLFPGGFLAGLLQLAAVPMIAAFLNLIKIAILYLIALLLSHRLVDRVLRPVLAKEGPITANVRALRAKTLAGMTKSVVSYVLFFVALVMALDAIQVNITGILTTAGVLGLAVGFGAQKLVRDVISGFFILLENQFSVGEHVTLAGVTGVVEEIGMRISKLRDEAGKLYIIPNGDIAAVCNYSRGAVSVSVEVSVAPDTDPQKVADLLNRVGQDLAREKPGCVTALRYLGMTAMDATRLTLKFTGSCQSSSSDDLQMVARARFREALLAEGISLV